ncbi:serine/threonine-protein kinase [Chloracidobacterium aggregatum]|uniref:Serine/threonine protein kinase n=1 Tax=Chloracidobacterium sp. N TaxID=2821540 RepID=A0ABX8AY08_9BACT|nr:serine/threonine-protein kinase [Chloracidobacterium aggregatum]QUV84049.1 serine/threonine protein kinase [Chloracidobacterium sp. 2]QUV87465.1 serine/threonine protein kinase [Chloracidobacterium sp. S]QUV90367.1 serine/threonine protein kinase [Chloracidobacterium sp. A]QUV93579.1 serine/threonine protein kinase [Chloracidobacterium sp. N]
MRDASVPHGASAVPPALLAGLTMRLPLDVTSDPAPREASQNDPFLGRTLDGKYRIEQRIGRGGSGTVYRARHLLIHRTVAVKVLSLDLVSDDDALARFRREAAMAGRLKHFNIVSVTDFGLTPDGVAYLVMDFIEGRSLRRILNAQGTLAPEKLVGWLKPICSAVHAAHRKGIIHRDLKPDNVMIEVVDGEEIPRVLDFGIAKLMDAVAVGTDFTTETGSVMGTPHYMSPEQCEGKPLDARSDIYSLGTLVYELLTGNVPFPGKVTTTVMMQQVTAAPRPLRDLRPDLPEAVELCVMRALSKNPAARHATALDFALEFEAALSSPAPCLHTEEPASNPALDFRAQLRQAAAVAPPVLLPRGGRPPSEELPATPVVPLPVHDRGEAHSGPESMRAAEARSSTEKLSAPAPSAPAPPPPPEVASIRPEAVAPVAGTVDRAPEPSLPAMESAAAAAAAPARASKGVALKAAPEPVRSSSPTFESQPVWAIRRTAAWPWMKTGMLLVGLVVLTYALAMYLLYRQANFRLGAELAALARDRQQPLATLRERTAARLAARKLEVESVRVRLDPPNQQVMLHVRYRRTWLGWLPLRFEAEGQAQPVAMTLDTLAGITPSQAEVVNVSPREIERYRSERQSGGSLGR